eukprot:s621_g6.t1
MPFYPRALTLIINSLTAMSRDEEAAEPGVTSEACAQFAYSNFEAGGSEGGLDGWKRNETNILNSACPDSYVRSSQ